MLASVISPEADNRYSFSFGACFDASPSKDCSPDKRASEALGEGLFSSIVVNSGEFFSALFCRVVSPESILNFRRYRSTLERKNDLKERQQAKEMNSRRISNFWKPLWIRLRLIGFNCSGEGALGRK